MSNEALKSAPSMVGTSGDSLREAFGKALAELAPEFPQLVVLDADVAGGTGAHHVRSEHPDRFLQFGIAEQNMVAAAAGMASVGLLPVVTSFAVFHLRAFEQVRLSVAYSGRNVKLVASHPGLDVGPDGGSAQCLEDLAAYRSIPGMTVLSPADPVEVRAATRAMLEWDGPVYMRTGRSPARRIFEEGHQFRIGEGSILRDGTDLTIVACGVEVARALDAAAELSTTGIDARVVNMPTIAPIDGDLLARCASETGAIVTAEDHSLNGGLRGAVAESVTSTCPVPIESVGLSTFGTSGEPEELAEHFGIDAAGIARAARRAVLRRSKR